MLQDTLRAAAHTSPMKPAPASGRRTSCPRSSTGGEEKRSGGGGEESGERSHLQLFQASEGARELARMIDSLSKAPSLDGRSKDIAKDLLRGARDLQSSLAMLARLQEASKSSNACRSRVKGRLEQRTAKRFALREEVGSEEAKGWRTRQRPEFLKQEMGVGEIMVSERLGSRKSRFSVDGSSRNGAEETKTTSRLKFKQRFQYTEEGTGGVGVQKPRSSGRSSGELERTSRFKLKQRPERVEEAFCAEQTTHPKRFGSPEEEPRRLSVDSIEELRRVIKDGLSRQEEEPSGPTPAIILQPKQAKGPNLIAKLMGLEEEVPPATNKTEDERRRKTKSLITPRPAFDIVDRPKARKTQAAETTTTPNPTQKSLHEIVAALQFKGLLKSGRGFDASQFKMFSRSFNKEEEEEEVPPIVIMKPLYLPHWERRETKSTEESSGGVSPMANALTTVAQKLQRRKKGSKNSKNTDEGHKQLLHVVKKEEKDDIEKKIIQISASKNKISQTTSSTSVAKENKKKKKNTSAAKSIRRSADNKAEDGHCEDGRRGNLQEGKDLFPKRSSLAVHGLAEGAYKQAKPCIQDVKREDSCEMMQKTDTRVASEVEEDLMCLLLSSRSFTNHAKELFLIDAHHQPVHYKRRGIGEDVMRNAKLYLDCGKELMARKSNQAVNKHYSLCGSSAFPSLTRLAEEISTLVASYSRIDYNVTSDEDELYPRLERDLRGKDTMMASANWDIGWADWVCTEEASRVVGEVEEFILGWLLTEVAQYLVSM